MAAAPLAFRSFEVRDQNEVVSLLSIGRPPRYSALKSAVFDWQFQRNPHSDGESPFLVGVVADGSIVALNGFMPARILFHRQPMLSRWSCDTYVSPAYRGQGFGKALVRRVSDAAPVMLGYGISDMSDPIFNKQGWLLHPEIALLFCHVAETGVIGRLKNLGSRFLRTATATRFSSTVTCEVGAPFSDEVDELWTASAPGYISTVQRDAGYLNWRYCQHPLHQYISYHDRSHGRLRGVMVARHDPVESVIVDYCGPADDVAVMDGLAAAVVEDLARRGTIRIRCETTHPPMIEALKRAGLLQSRHVSRFRVRSNTGETEPLRGWFLMTGDSDNDVLSGLDEPAPGQGG